MPGHRPEFGDTLIPTLARGIANIDSLARSAIKAREAQDARAQELAFAREESQKDRAFRQQQFEFNKEQAKNNLMRTLINSVDEPYQKAAIAKQYGQLELSNQYAMQDEKETNQKDSLREFYQLTEPSEVISGAASALSTLDPTSNAFFKVQERRDEAIDSKKTPLSELMKDARFAARFNMIDSQLKTIGQKPEFYESALNRIDSLVAEFSPQATAATGKNIKAALVDDDEDILSRAFQSQIPGVSLDLDSGTIVPEVDETGSNVEEVAKASFEKSTQDILALESIEKQLANQETNLKRLKSIGALPKNGEERLQKITEDLQQARDQLKETKEIRRQAGSLSRQQEFRFGSPTRVMQVSPFR